MYTEFKNYLQRPTETRISSHTHTHNYKHVVKVAFSSNVQINSDFIFLTVKISNCSIKESENKFQKTILKL